MPGPTDMSLDPSALFTNPTLSTLSSKAGLAAAQAAKNASVSASAAKASSGNVVPRVDLEPLYSGLKACIGEHWAAYKEAIGLFVLGRLNQNEFCLRTDHFLSGDTAVEHLHNQLLIGIFANVGRDQPEPGVAPWVSANDKPVITSKPTAGDAAEQRLKTEVMQLPPRDRRRVKDIPEPELVDGIPTSVTEYHLAKQFRTSDQGPPSAGGKTNWDLEIRKRFTQPLAAESGEFPDAEIIQGRMIPICYGESLPNGAAATCASFMATATEHFIKEILSSIYGRTRSNINGGSVNGVLTHRFKAQLQYEEDALAKGQIEKVIGTGLLPVENKEASTRSSLAMHDLKLALSVGDVGLGQYPLSMGRVMTSYDEGEYEAYQERRRENLEWRQQQQAAERDRHAKMAAAGAAAAVGEDLVMSDVHAVNGGFLNGFDGMLDEDENDDWGWDGGSAASRALLADSLDSCLAIGM